MKEELPVHLGGHFGVCHIDSGVLQYAINKLNITSMLDIGCGLGGMVELGMSYGLDSYGIDGEVKSEPLNRDWVDKLCGINRETVYLDLKGDEQSLTKLANELKQLAE